MQISSHRLFVYLIGMMLVTVGALRLNNALEPAQHVVPENIEAYQQSPLPTVFSEDTRLRTEEIFICGYVAAKEIWGCVPFPKTNTELPLIPSTPNKTEI